MKYDRNQQIEEIYELITELAAGNLTRRGNLYENDEELDTITLGVNMLAEELQSSTISLDYLDKIYRSIPELVFELDTNFIIQRVNEVGIKKLQKKEKDIIGKNIINFINLTKSQKKSFKENPLKFLEIRQAEMKVYGLEPINILINHTNLEDEQRNKNGYFWIARDVTEIVEQGKVIAELNQELNMFIYRSSHDLKGPLSSMKGLLNISHEEFLDPEIFNSTMNYLKDSIEKLDRIVFDFINLGNITQNESRKEPINFEEVLHNIHLKLEQTPGYKEVNFIQTIKVDKEFVCNSLMLKTIIENLLSNGVVFRDTNKEAKKVFLQIGCTGKRLEIVVEDNGLGMNQRSQSRMFEMFFKGLNISKGNGMGLYLVKSCVNAMQGKIQVKSTLGEGTRITIYLPNNNQVKT